MKMFFILSFIPSIAYWYLESHYSLTIALIGGVGLAIVELLIEWIFTRHLHSLSKFNFFLLTFLAILSFLGEEGIWFKMQPALSSFGIASFLSLKLWCGEGLFEEMVKSMGKNRSLPTQFLRQLEMHFVILMVIYGSLMVVVGIFYTTDLWLFYKTIGSHLFLLAFFIFEIIYMRIRVRKYRKSVENGIVAFSPVNNATE